MTEFDEIHVRLGIMHGYAMEKCPTCGCWLRDPTARPGARCECGAVALHGYARQHARDCMVRAHHEWACTCGADGLVLAAANGLSQPCRANRHDECVDAGCVCPCHVDDE